MSSARPTQPVALTTLRVSYILSVLLILGVISLAIPQGHAAPGAELKPGNFLVATPNLDGTSFEKTVILITDHSHRGAIGVAINRPSEFKLSDMVPDLASEAFRQQPLFLGGPVHPKSVLFLKDGPGGYGVRRVLKNLWFGGGTRVLIDILDKNTPPKTLRAYAGYSGWAPGQLEAEIDRGDWTLSKGDQGMVFSQDVDTIWSTLSSQATGTWI